MRTFRSFVASLLLGLACLGCTPSVLETHIRSANDVRVLNAETVGQLRGRCPEADASEECTRVRAVQHSFADAHTQWVHELESDRRAGRWDAPEDGDALRLVLLSYLQLRAEAEQRLGVAIPTLPESFRRIAGAQ